MNLVNNNKLLLILQQYVTRELLLSFIKTVNKFEIQEVQSDHRQAACFKITKV